MALVELALYVLAGVLAGLASGLFGVGGGVIAVPAAILIGGLTFHEAKAASLIVLLLGGASAAWHHHRAGHVRARLGLVLGASGAAGAAAASKWSIDIPEGPLETAFGVLLVATALRLWVPTPERPDRSFPLPVAVVVGLVGGALAGLFGVGGGIVMVPAMTMMGVRIHEAVGTSLVSVLTNGAVAAAAHAALGFSGVMLVAGVPMGLAAVASSWAGTALAKASPAARLRRFFAVFLAALGVRFVLVGAGAL